MNMTIKKKPAKCKGCGKKRILYAQDKCSECVGKEPSQEKMDKASAEMEEDHQEQGVGEWGGSSSFEQEKPAKKVVQVYEPATGEVKPMSLSGAAFEKLAEQMPSAESSSLPVDGGRPTAHPVDQEKLDELSVRSEMSSEEREAMPSRTEQLVGEELKRFSTFEKQGKVEREMRRFQEPGKPFYVVRQDPNGVVWCTCPAWIESVRRPKTCPHMAEMVVERGEEGEYADNADMISKNVLPPAYEMSGQERGIALQLIARAEERKDRAAKRGRPIGSRSVSFRDPREQFVVFERVSAAFAALRKKGFCAVQEQADEAETVAWFRDRPKYRALVFTLKSDVAAFKVGGELTLHVFSRSDNDGAMSLVEEVAASLGGGLSVALELNKVRVAGLASENRVVH